MAKDSSSGGGRTTKSGLETPATYKTPASPGAPVKVYPASSKIGKGGGHGDCIEGPGDDKYPVGKPSN